MAPFTGVKIKRAPGINPKTHGHIPGVPVGKTFPNRAECSQAGVHAPLQSGIHGTAVDGAYSIVLSGGYADDADYGKTILFTGQGGRDTSGTKMDQLKGKTLWEGPQARDQEWVYGNKALKMSCIHGTPVRVVRGPNPNSTYAPISGYRYDGLYKVVSAWRERGKAGYMMCRFEFRRLKGQPPLPNYPIKKVKTDVNRLQTDIPATTAVKRDEEDQRQLEREIFGEEEDEEDEDEGHRKDDGEDGEDMKVDEDEAIHNNDDEELNEEEEETKPDITHIHSTPLAGPSTRPHPYHAINTRSKQFHPYTRNNIKSEHHTTHLRKNSKIIKLEDSDEE